MLASTSLHNDMLNLSELIVGQHTAELLVRRRRLTTTTDDRQDDRRWQQEVECFIDEVIEESGCHARSSPECLRAIRWMIASATAQFETARR